MSDIASYMIRDEKTGDMRVDWLMDGPDLAGDDGLATAMVISLFTDRLADADDLVPGAAPSDSAGPPDRRGWWGDMPADPASGDAAPVLTGSRFWLRAGWPANAQTLRRIELDAREALKWLIDDGVAQSIDVATQWAGRDVVSLQVTVSQRSAAGRTRLLEFDYVWSPTLAVQGSPPPTLPAPVEILMEHGGSVLTEDGGYLLEE
jgi:phage gp46-like protein